MFSSLKRKELEAELAARTEEEKELSDETEALKSKVYYQA